MLVASAGLRATSYFAFFYTMDEANRQLESAILFEKMGKMHMANIMLQRAESTEAEAYENRRN